MPLYTGRVDGGVSAPCKRTDPALHAMWALEPYGDASPARVTRCTTKAAVP